MRAAALALGIKQVKRVATSFLQPEGVKVHGSLHRPVDPADVDRELVVDEHPDIIIPSKRELFTAVVLDIEVHLHGEVIIVARRAVGLPAFLVQRKEPPRGEGPEIRAVLVREREAALHLLA